LIRAAFLACVTGWLLLAVPALADSQRPENALGETIYREGRGREPIAVRIGEAGADIAASNFTCVSCHREDLAGVSEGGLRVPPISWDVLRNVRGYDKASFAAAIRTGRDPQGRSLSNAMPRFTIGESDLQALFSYLAAQTVTDVPGVGSDAVRIAALVPGAGIRASLGREIERALQLMVNDSNSKGRRHGRKIVFEPARFDSDRPGDALRAAREIVERGNTFAVMASVGLPADEPAFAYLHAQGVPHLAPLLSPFAAADATALFIKPSIESQVRGMVAFAAQWPLADRQKGLAILYSSDFAAARGESSAREEAQSRGVSIVASERAEDDPLALARRMQQSGARGLLALVDPKLLAPVLAAAQEAGWRPVVFGLGANIAGATVGALRDLGSEAFFSSTHGQIDPRAQGVLDFRRVIGGLGGSNQELQRDAYVAMQLLVEGLNRAGRRLTREGFMQSLAAIKDFETGVMPALTYRGGRFEGKAPVSIARFDPQRGQLMPFLDRP
jgi:ABC-type branched-subunit amino acid transport system substrate-binding protein